MYEHVLNVSDPCLLFQHRDIRTVREVICHLTYNLCNCNNIATADTPPIYL